MWGVKGRIEGGVTRGSVGEKCGKVIWGVGLG